MLDKELFVHPLEDEVFAEAGKYIKFEKELRTYYRDYVKPTLIPDLYGKTIKVTKTQLGWVYKLAEQIATVLDMKVPDIFVYQNFYYLVESKGMDDNWIEISAKTLTDLSKEELIFLLAKEMCAIKLRYTYYETLITQEIDTAENVSFLGSQTLGQGIKVKMYHFLRITGYTTDNFAYLICKNLRPCINAIIKIVLNDIYLAEQLCIPEFLKQGETLNALQEDIHNFTKMDELSPYSPFRIQNLIAYASSDRGHEALMNHSLMEASSK